MAQSWHPIASISPADFDGFDDYTHEGYARINEADCISSYNWLDKEEETPTIVVPGMPRLWTPRIGPTVMPADFSQYFESEHAFRHSQSRLEPLFRAVYCSEPMFDINTVDVVAERGSLRRLMRFINPRLKSADGHDFKLHFEVNNKTLLISRGEGGKSTYTISKHQSRTNPNYGHTFENFYSTNLIPGSTSHYRVMKYGFGSLNVLVCDETDGFVQDRYIYYADPTREEVIPADPGLDVFDEGKRVPQESILEMKTRGKKGLPFDYVPAQMWLAQTPLLVVARHKNGRFDVPQVKSAVEDTRKWEEWNQPSLKVLAGLLGRIRKIVGDRGGRAEVQFNSSTHELEFWQLDREQNALLPRDLYEHWDM